MASRLVVVGVGVKGERSESAGHEVPLAPGPETTLLDQPGEAENSTTQVKEEGMTQKLVSMSAHPGIDRAFDGLPALLTLDEVAELLWVHRNTLDRWRRKGVGPEAHRLPGGQCRYQRDEVLAWLRASCVCAGGLAAGRTEP